MNAEQKPMLAEVIAADNEAKALFDKPTSTMQQRHAPTDGLVYKTRTDSLVEPQTDALSEVRRQWRAELRAGLIIAAEEIGDEIGFVEQRLRAELTTLRLEISGLRQEIERLRLVDGQ